MKAPTAAAEPSQKNLQVNWNITIYMERIFGLSRGPTDASVLLPTALSPENQRTACRRQLLQPQGSTQTEQV
ncbi:hypothetical protein SRHO_G00132560 [Serrasalmus rhombeus]